jgi:uncharacterized membrane protein
MAEKPGIEISEVLPGLGQLADAASTLDALDKGAEEKNPILKKLVKKPVAFVATKLGIGILMGKAVDFFNDRGKEKEAKVLSGILTALGLGPAINNTLQKKKK